MFPDINVTVSENFIDTYADEFSGLIDSFLPLIIIMGGISIGFYLVHKIITLFNKHFRI